MSKILDAIKNKLLFGEVRTAKIESSATARMQFVVEEDGVTKKISLTSLKALLEVDTTAPTVTLASSSSEVTNTGTITLTATASDNVGITKVEFYRNGSLFATDSSAPYTAVETLNAPQQGTYTYTARAYDAAGNATMSSPVSVQVNIQPSQDTLAPTVSLSVSKTTMSEPGNILLSSTASDNVGVDRVEFYRGETLLSTKTSAPYTHTDTLTSTNNGTHLYTARAYDVAGNSATSSVRTVEVNIASPGTLDTDTLNEYRSAISGASAGTKRNAGANAVKNALSPAYRLNVYRDDILMIQGTYSGDISVLADETDVFLQLGQVQTSPMSSGDIDTGTWRFEVQGGAGFSRKISGSAGPVGSTSGIKISLDSASGLGLVSPVKFVVPRSIDGLQ